MILTMTGGHPGINLLFSLGLVVVVICSMNYIGPSGEPVQVSGICTLPINILNEIPTDVQLVIKFRISKVTKEYFELTEIYRVSHKKCYLVLEGCSTPKF